MVTAIPKTNTNLAGLVLVLVPCVPSWRQIDVAMPDFRGANWKRFMSYFTLRWLSKKCKCWGRKSRAFHRLCGRPGVGPVGTPRQASHAASLDPGKMLVHWASARARVPWSFVVPRARQKSA